MLPLDIIQIYLVMILQFGFLWGLFKWRNIGYVE